MMNADMEVEHIDDVAAKNTVDQVADNPGVKQRFGKRNVKNAFPFPDKQCKREESENRERPDLPLKHPPGAAAVLDIGQIEHSRNNGKRRGLFPKDLGDSFRELIDEHKIRRQREEYEKNLHPQRITAWPRVPSGSGTPCR